MWGPVPMSYYLKPKNFQWKKMWGNECVTTYGLRCRTYSRWRAWWINCWCVPSMQTLSPHQVNEVPPSSPAGPARRVSRLVLFCGLVMWAHCFCPQQLCRMQPNGKWERISSSSQPNLAPKTHGTCGSQNQNRHKCLRNLRLWHQPSLWLTTAILSDNYACWLQVIVVSKIN